MVQANRETTDPRIRRTRLALQQALESLLKTKSFDSISVQDIAEEAAVNRVTFYDHYGDKFALLECLVGTRFQQYLDQRNIRFDCSSALKAIVLSVCDYLSGTQALGSERHSQLEPHLESAVIAVVGRFILSGIREHPSETAAPPEMIATTLSWAIYGAAQQWARTPNRGAPEQIVETIITLVSPMLQPSPAPEPTH